MRINDILVIVPAGSASIWNRNSAAGPTEAYNAFIDPSFKINRAYAERFADRWVILSAKYGFIRPNFIIPGPDDVSFMKQSTNPVHLDTLREQINELRLDTFRVAVGLGGRKYRFIVDLAFEGSSVITVFPFAELPPGKSVQIIKHAIEIGDSGIPRTTEPPPRILG